jgi:hypothetical protein
MKGEPVRSLRRTAALCVVTVDVATGGTDPVSAVYSGRQILHGRGGQVAVGLTDPARSTAVREHLARFGVGRVDVRHAEAIQAQLDQRVKQAQVLLRAGRAAGERPNIEVSRRSLGKVTVRVARHAASPLRA